MTDTRFIIYYKKPDTYVYRYDPESREALTQLVCKQAANPQLNLSWYDAALIVKTAKDMLKNRFSIVRF